MGKKRSGFTLAELLVVVVIIAMAVAISIPIFASNLDKARKVTCDTNQRALSAAISVAVLSDAGLTFEQAFDDIYSDDPDEYPCPSHGTFTYQAPADGNGRGAILCSVHSNPGGGDPGGEYPGGNPGETYKDEKGNDTGLIIRETYNVWPHQSVFSGSSDWRTFPASAIFQYTDGEYYIISTPINMNNAYAAQGPGEGGPVYASYATHKLTGKVVTYTYSGEQKNGLQRGDLCKDGDSYYVFVDGGQYAYSCVWQY